MKKIVFFLGITAVLFFLCGTARADSINFLDDGPGDIHWDGYASSVTTENDLDELGIPKIAGGTVEYTAGTDTNTLDKITLDYSGVGTWSMLKPGDLFIDLGADGDWDYIAQSGGTQTAGTWNVYSAPAWVEGTTTAVDYYYMTPATGHVYYPGYGTFDVRNGHPYAAKNLSEYVGTVDFGGWADPGTGSLTTYWDFTLTGSPDIEFSKLAIGYTVTCANDVIYEVIDASGGFNPVPVPGAVWLLGSGLLALVGLRRKFSA